jgi:MOSC domain-containing protein YiiM
VYAYARESYAWWEGELGWELVPGTFGENLTLEGVEVDEALIGERWEIGTTVLAVTAPRIPCVKLATRVGDPKFVKRFAQARRPGAYLRIVQEGELRAGDEVRVALRPEHGVTIALVNEALLHDHSLAARILQAPQLHARARAWALEQAA